MRRSLFLAGLCLPASLAAAGCGGDSTGPNGASLCGTTQGVEVCAARAQYSPAESVETRITNRSSGVLYIDACSIKPVGKTSRSAEYEVAYSPTVQCGEDVDLEEIVSKMVELGAGESTTLSPRIAPFAFQGFYRINVWILDASGERTSNLPAFSGTFEVFPSAGG